MLFWPFLFASSLNFNHTLLTPFTSLTPREFLLLDVIRILLLALTSLIVLAVRIDARYHGVQCMYAEWPLTPGTFSLVIVSVQERKKSICSIRFE